MRHIVVLIVALVVAAGAATAAEPPQNPPTLNRPTQNAPAPKKRSAVRRSQGFGFLPGYRTPEQIERQDSYLYWRRHPGYFWYGGPGFYRGRWNGGGFGPCWTQTPIGPVWNCGR